MFKSTIWYFFLPSGLWLLHQILVINYLHFSFLNNYLDDLVVVPIIMGISLIIQQKYISNNLFTYNFKTIIGCWLYFCVIFELVIPKFNNNYTADWLDCLAYGFGALYFNCFQNKPIKTKNGI